MRLDLGPSIETVRTEALAMIDKQAEAANESIRPMHRSTMDFLRLSEAQQALKTPLEDCTAQLFPALAAIPGSGDFHTKASMIIEASKQVSLLCLALETGRLAAKEAVRSATSVPAIRAITLESYC